MDEHAVIVHLPNNGSELALDLVEDPLIHVIEAAGVGEFDGNDIRQDEAVLYMYGPDADALFAVVGSLLHTMELPSGSFAVKRYGPPGASEIRISL